jgi:hypothetical protein
MNDITYDIYSFQWDSDSKTFYGDAWNLVEVEHGTYYQVAFPNGKQQFFIKNYHTNEFRRFRFLKEIETEYTFEWLFESEDGIKCMICVEVK